ncbi:lipoamide acyltransferase component of [Trichuris trichiura]|uniref:Dihydrolipoamide acetyltransferase component of pyruvate dehydrogenase complex n=1 Tax=Trichuris trichiura TaxID=36087 RepID=A0A077Z2U7_TRITR|nr:lipoamide acyltransferase component of [Trichuris trichiura]
MFARSIAFVIKQLNFSFVAVFADIVPFKLTDIGEGIAEVQIKQWFVDVNDKIKEFDRLCEVQSDKASVTVTSRYSGTVRKLHFSVDDVVPVGSTLVDIETEDSSNDGEGETEAKAADSSVESYEVGHDTKYHEQQLKETLLATPAVRNLAREKQIDLQQVIGSGPNGRITKNDVLNHVEKLKRTSVDAPEISFKPVVADYKVVPIRGYARTMLKNMTVASSIPHFTFSDEVSLKESLKQAQSADGTKITYMPFFVKALSFALHKYPIMNAQFDEKRGSISAHNVCFAVDTPDGLVAPSIKNCERKGVLEIASEIFALRRKALEGTLSHEELTGGTITLSNIGTIGGTFASPVLLPPQITIGAIGRIQLLPRYDKEKRFQPMFILCVSWSADHRVLDGATVAKFSNVWKEYVETPSLIDSTFH